MTKRKEKLRPSTKIAAITLIIFGVSGLVYFSLIAFGKKDSLPVLGEPGHIAGSFSFVNQDGNRVTEESVRNKVTVVEYFFTSCPSICPVMNRNLKDLYDMYKDNPDFMILSHTVDPERDSVSRLNAYARRYDAKTPGWQFLTGDKQALYKCASRDYLLSAGDSGTVDFIHTQYVTLLDRNRRIRGFYDLTSKEKTADLASDIRRLLKEDSVR